jgi:hypothetical protein
LSSFILETSESEEEVKEVNNAGTEECAEAVKEDEVGEETENPQLPQDLGAKREALLLPVLNRLDVFAYLVDFFILFVGFIFNGRKIVFY